jgi:hypothetical protein
MRLTVNTPQSFMMAFFQEVQMFGFLVSLARSRSLKKESCSLMHYLLHTADS